MIHVIAEITGNFKVIQGTLGCVASAFTAPASMDFQYSWVVPLGMNAIW